MTYRVERSDPRRDHDEIVALWKCHLPLLPHPERNLAWAYVDNPFSPGRLWKLTADGRTVGVVGLALRRIKVGDAVVLAGRLGGLAIDQRHRSLGPALLLQRAALEDIGQDGLSFIYTSSPQNLVQMSSRAGYRPVVTLTRYVKLLDAGPFLRRRVRSGAAARLLAWPSNLAIRMAERLRRRQGLVREIERFDDRFDNLWTRGATHYGVTSERTSRFLQWRFRHNPVDHSFRTVGVTSPGDGRLAGYGVCVMEDGGATLVDLFADNTETALHTVLSGIVRWTRARGATSIAVKCAGNSALDAALRRQGFRPRPENHPTTLMVSATPAGPADPAHARGPEWHFLAADDFWH